MVRISKEFNEPRLARTVLGPRYEDAAHELCVGGDPVKLDHHERVLALKHSFETPLVGPWAIGSIAPLLVVGVWFSHMAWAWVLASALLVLIGVLGCWESSSYLVSAKASAPLRVVDVLTQRLYDTSLELKRNRVWKDRKTFHNVERFDLKAEVARIKELALDANYDLKNSQRYMARERAHWQYAFDVHTSTDTQKLYDDIESMMALACKESESFKVAFEDLKKLQAVVDKFSKMDVEWRSVDRPRSTPVAAALPAVPSEVLDRAVSSADAALYGVEKAVGKAV